MLRDMLGDTNLCDLLSRVGGNENVLAALAVLPGAHVQLQGHALHPLNAHVLRLVKLEPLRRILILLKISRSSS